MFIVHGGRLRKYAPWILAGVLVLLLPGFILLFSPAGNVKQERSELPTIGGKPVNSAEFQREKNLLTAQVIINTHHQPPRTVAFEDQLDIEAVQHVVLLRKAKELGVRVSDDEVVRQIRMQPVFLTEQGQFDAERYRQFFIFLNNYGVSEMQFEEMMREQITLMRLRNLVAIGAKVTPTELKLSYTPLHEETTIDYVELDAANNKEKIEIKDDDAQTYYGQHKADFRQSAEMKVRYVYFTLEDAKKSVTLGDDEIAEFYKRNQDQYLDTEKKPKPLDDVKDEVKKDLLTLRAERLAGDRATGFSVKLVQEPGTARPDFAKIAADSGVTPQETDFFGVSSSIPGVNAGRPFNQAAFALSPESSFSDPVRGEDGYYVLEYMDSKPSKIQPFDDVKEQVIDRLKRQHAYEATVKQGHDLAAKVKQATAGGQSFTSACAALGLKVKSFKPFTVAEETPGSAR